MSGTTNAGDAAAADRWALVQDVLGEAIEYSGEKRRALVDGRCGADADLRREVESLLLAHEQKGVVDLLGPLVSPASALLREPVSDWSGHTVAEYVVQQRIGVGGMGVVYKARDERLGRHVALKFLPPALSVDPAAKARFIAEARAAAALDHPNVCTIYGIGETGDGQLFIAMPLYEGETLGERIARGRLTFDEALPIALQVAGGLEHAHDAGIVHLDVKPSNIVVLPDGTAKILDFGIAQIHHAPLVDPQAMIGTVPYMSPEQAAGRAVDRRSDIWSLAVVVHEMLVGRRPFDGVDGKAVVQAILHADPVLAATSHPDVPASLDRVLSIALAKPPGDRHASMSAFASELSAAASERAGPSVEIDDPQRMSATERRRAAVLVTVVSDYPSLVDRLAPADAQRAVARVRELAVDVAREYGGLVNQAIGDEIVSLFGVPSAHEDDELRAVRAALDLHARVQAIDPGEFPAGLRLRVQSGLHVGPVVARRLPEGPRRYDIVGAPLTQASRLAVLAAAGDLWVSPETHRLIGPYMQTAACAAIVLDSQAAAVTPFRVLGETGIATRLEASSRTGLTPYVGRQCELLTLQARVTRSAAAHGSVVAVVGEPGAGKSRLLYELQERLCTEPGLRLVQARCRAYGDGVPYGVFVQILCAALDLHSPLTSSEVVARVRGLDRSLERFLPLYLHLLSLESDVYALPKHLRGAHLQAALLDALAAAVGALTRLGPLVVVIEDWHWSDTGSRAAFVRVADLAAALPLTLIVTSRAENAAVDRWPSSTTFVRLERLDFAASTSIVEAGLGVREVSRSFARRLYERAGGNPFFLEQMCAALLEQGVVTVRDGGAVVEDEENWLVLPDTVQGVIRARLDILDARTLEVARIAAVIGREFDHALLAEVAPADVDLRSAIAAATAAGLIRQTSVTPTLTYRFTHALTHEVCYDSLLAHQRQTLHGAIGRALAAMHATDERASLLAHHFARAEEWPAAVHYGRLAAARAIALSQFGDALAILDDVLEWTGRVADRRNDVVADVLLKQERVCETLGLRARQQQIIDTLIARLAREGSSSRLAEVYLRQGDLSTLLKRFDAADRALTTALRIGQEREDTALVRSGLRSLGLLRWHEGRHAEAVAITQRALALDREGGDDVAVAVDLTNLGNILKAMGDYRGARARLEEALAMPALRADPKKLVYTQHNLASVYRESGDLDRALACLAESDEIAHVHLLPIQRSFHLTSMAHIHLQQGRIDDALTTYRTAVDLSRHAQHAEGLVQSLRMLGNALLALERYDEALPLLQEAAQLFAQLEDRGSEAEMRTGIARILERTSVEEAEEAWSVVLDLQRTRGDSRGELQAREGLARAMRERGGDAVSAFESARALAATIGDRARETAIRNTLGILEWERESYAAAVTHYECALALAREDSNVAHEVVILNGLGASLTRLGRPDEARTVLEEGLALSRTIGERQLEGYALAALGHVSLTTGDRATAAQRFEQSRRVRQAIDDRAGAKAMEDRLASLAREP